MPEVANYFNEPSHLIFNPNLNLTINYNHIIDDNRDRLAFIESASRNEILSHLKSAIDRVKIEVKRNYKLAVPQWFNNKIQLLLPLRMEVRGKEQILALVVDRINNNSYDARTILTVDMAYNNARLIVNPGSDWLNPENIAN